MSPGSGARLVITALCVACVLGATSASRWARDLTPAPPAPTLDSPKCIHAAEARAELPADEELAVGRNGEYCAYPLRMMTYHRIVNDHLGGPPILVVYDPDSGAGRVFDPVLEGNAHTFDVAAPQRGLPAVQDRETKSVWSAITGKALAGPMAGKQMAVIPSMIITWERWNQLHPDSWTLAEDARQSPHYVTRGTPAAFSLPVALRRDLPRKPDRRLPADTLVLGVDLGGEQLAFPLTPTRGGLFSRPAGTVTGTNVLARGEQAYFILADRDGHAAAAYLPVRDQVALAILPVERPGTGPGKFTDRKTGSSWSVDGRCTAGTLKGHQLPPANCIRLRWYAWSALYPKTELVP